MKYYILLTSIYFISGQANGAESQKTEPKKEHTYTCAYEKLAYSEGFVLVLENGSKFLRCTKVITSNGKVDVAWVMVNKKPNDKNTEFILKAD